MKHLNEYLQSGHLNHINNYEDFLKCLIKKPTLENQYSLVNIVSSAMKNNSIFLNIADLNKFTRDDLLQYAKEYFNEKWFMLIMYANQEKNSLTKAYTVDIKDGNTFSLRKDNIIYGKNGKAIEKYFDNDENN